MKKTRENGPVRDGGGGSFFPDTDSFPVSNSPEGLQSPRRRHSEGVLSAIKGYLTDKCISGVAQEPPSTTTDDNQGLCDNEPLIEHHRDGNEVAPSLPQAAPAATESPNAATDGQRVLDSPQVPVEQPTHAARGKDA